jgi:hypothetical protein
MDNTKESEQFNRLVQLFGVPENEMYLVIKRYFTSYPEKYYNEQAYKEYYHFFDKVLAKDKSVLLNFISDREEAFNISYKLLSNINKKEIHEAEVKTTDAGFIDENINYNYLQLLEGVLLLHVQLVAYMQFLEEGKGTDNLDLYTCVNKLNKSGFVYIEDIYEHNVRNGIGHGKIVYFESKAEYIDKKGNKSAIYYNKFIKKFDKLVDVVNGFALAYMVFWLKELKVQGVAMPRQLLFEEIKLKNTSSEIVITGILGQDILNKRVLVIRILSNCLNENTLIDKIKETAFNTVQLTGFNYDIIQVDVTHNNWSGYVKFSVEEIDKIFNSSYKNKDYSLAVIDSLEFYLMGFKEDMPASMDSNYFNSAPSYTAVGAVEEKVGLFIYKDISQNVNSYNDFMRVKDARYIYNGVDKEKSKIVRLIKKYLPDLLKHTKKKSNELTKANGHELLPIKYICIAIYEQDLRARALRSNGVKPNLICTIQYNSTDRIGNIKLMNSQTENFQGAFFNWNHYWRNAEAYEKMFPE